MTPPQRMVRAAYVCERRLVTAYFELRAECARPVSTAADQMCATIATSRKTRKIQMNVPDGTSGYRMSPLSQCA